MCSRLSDRCLFKLAFLGMVAVTAPDGRTAEPASSAANITAEQRDFFESSIRPILIQNCYECHSAETAEPEGNLRLDSRAAWMRGGDSGPAIVPGAPDKSRLIEAIRYESVDLQMPPDAKLAADEIAVLSEWVAMGAPDPRAEMVDTASPKIEPFDLEKRRREHWAWQPLRPGGPPPVGDEMWPRHDLDRYILARLEAAGISPAPPAEKRTWLRRVSFDLIGLPPTPDEMADFLADDSEMAFQRVVDRLLRSPHYGEHWGQHWLDLVRYAETRGHEQDFGIPESYRFRDYVILALNEDVPYDQFVIEHIAGDLVAAPRLHPQDRSNQLIQGTGFWHFHEATHSPVDICGDEADRVHNQIDVFSRTFLGLSMGCARCHDHKFDAISARDYYAMFGFLQSSGYQLADVSDPVEQQRLFDQLSDLRDDYARQLRERFVAMRLAQIERLPAYLLAAAELHCAGVSLETDELPAAAASPDGSAPQAIESLPEALISLAAEREMNPHTLWRVARHLRDSAASEVQDPLHVFARAMATTVVTADSADEVKAATKKELVAAADDARRRWANLKVIKSVKHGERNYAPQERAWSPAELVEDFEFSGPVPDRWITSGYRFGKSPVAVGSLLVGDAVDRPIIRFSDTSAAESEFVSDRFTGMIRTRTFAVTGDTLWYRYRGNADVFLAVDSHRVVNGPLHGVVKQKLSGGGHEWKWFAHNVRDYIGHRVHVEFTPGAGFALDKVLFAATEPPADLGVNTLIVAGLLERQTTGEDVLSQVALETAAVFRQALCDGARCEPNRDAASLLNWLVKNDSLLEPLPELQEPLSDAMKSYLDQRAELEQQIPSPIRALALLDGSGEDEPVHIRGSHRNRAPEPVPRAILAALRTDKTSRPAHGSGRLTLAQQLVDPANPLVPRVMVNRIWHHLLGRGIVETVDDFGVMGKPPTHPELLDFLARRFIENGWSIKQMIREIVLSSTYRMSSYPLPESERADPANELYHRMFVRRLPAESIRDHILAVSGRLDRRMFGPSVMVHITPFMRGNRSPKGSGPLDGDGRRSIYTEVRRNHLSAFLSAFDKPAPFMAIGKRSISNSPAQSLILLNDPFVHEQAAIWAKRLRQIDGNDAARLAAAYVWAFSRLPTDDERDAAMAFLDAQRELYASEKEADPDHNAWSDLCHTLMNVKEFVHIN